MTLVESLDELVAEIVDDLYLRHIGQERTTRCWATPTRCGWRARWSSTRQPSCGRKTRRWSRAPGSAWRSRKTFWPNSKSASRRRGILGYDDLLTRLADALTADGSPAQLRMHQRWPIVMSTSSRTPIPCSGRSSTARSPTARRLLLIGDPKQAIYAFRGGDIVTYLKASETAGVRRTLGKNWRSDAAS